MQAKRPFSPSGSSSPLPGGGLQGLLSALQPPDWVVDEVQNRVVLFLNHVLMQEPQARERLKSQQGKPVRLQWAGFHLTLAATPAGLVERAPPQANTDLVVTLTQSSPLDVVREVLSGDKPAVDIQGDVQLATELAWLIDNVRWDVEEDLSRFVGDAAAHAIVRAATTAAQGLRAFVGRLPGAGARREGAQATMAPASDSGGHPS